MFADPSGKLPHMKYESGKFERNNPVQIKDEKISFKPASQMFIFHGGVAGF